MVACREAVACGCSDEGAFFIVEPRRIPADWEIFPLREDCEKLYTQRWRTRRARNDRHRTWVIRFRPRRMTDGIAFIWSTVRVCLELGGDGQNAIIVS